ncbi:hypothetical protein Scep_009624 [Stephania cephalantha]|uniref:Uncharacterized protein n=1 Tax=Stephania cephalantha TaxID=152367 RepID=A0AAP0PCP1_9MAGN
MISGEQCSLLGCSFSCEQNVGVRESYLAACLKNPIWRRELVEGTKGHNTLHI